jgi:hypothetical protein
MQHDSFFREIRQMTNPFLLSICNLPQGAGNDPAWGTAPMSSEVCMHRFREDPVKFGIV